MTEQFPVIYGKYQLLEQLARGGMAEVYKAKAHGVEGFEKTLVIKRILPELSQNPRFVEMFVNEAKIAVTLSHANIVQVFDLGLVEKSYFIAMEYVAGMDTATLLKRLKRADKVLPFELAAYIVSEVAKGLDYAHRRRDAELKPLNIVHRDVSPQNVLLSYEGEVKLTDFGIAKARSMAQSVTEVGVVKGKYAFMAPEQLTGGDVDARSDIFAAGTLLYTVLSRGAHPFQGASVYETISKIKSGQARVLRELVPELPAEIDEVLEHAMAPSKEQRYGSAGELYEALIKFLYMTGRRIGPRDLADFLAQLEVSASSKRPEPGPQTGAEVLRAAFESDSIPSSDKSAHPLAEETRVARARPARRPSPSMVVPEALRNQAEWREVTAMVVRTSPEENLSPTSIGRLVARFGGVVVDDPRLDRNDKDKAVFALFGAKNPDGRDAENAARCALRILRNCLTAAAEQGRSTKCGVGVCAGRALINLTGGLLEDEAYKELFDATVAIAAESGPGQALANQDAHKALRGKFQLASAGKDQENLFLIIGERSLAETHRRFFGRRNDLKRIGQVLARANQGELQVVGLRGEAGAGKSRILAEAVRRLGLAGHSVGLHVTELFPQMREEPLSAVQQILRVMLGLDEFDPEPLLRERTTRLRELGLLAKDREVIEAVLGVPSKEARDSGYRPLRGAMQRIVEKLAEDRLTLLAWEGAEYIDEDSLLVIEHMLKELRRARVVIFLCHRTELAPRWPSYSWYTDIFLEPLSDDDVARLIASKLGSEEIPIELLRDVSIKCGGSPLYIEEYLGALLESDAVSFEDGQLRYRPDVANLEVPKTLRGIIASRISRLSPLLRYLLQVASVVGERFDIEVVANAAGEEVTVVSEAFSAQETQGVVTLRGPSEHAFTHDLIPQVLRDSLTLEVRRRIHLAVANALEKLHPEKLEEMGERLARHYREAGEYGKSVECLVRAADRFVASYALENATASLMKAIETLVPVGAAERERMLELYDRVGELSYRSSDVINGVGRMQRALRVAEALKADKYLARFSMWLGRILVSASHIEEGRKWLLQARHVARGVPDRVLSRDVQLASAEADSRSGDYEKAVGFLLEALQLSREAGDAKAEVECLEPLALTYARMGERESAISTIKRARTLAEQVGDRMTDSRLWWTESRVHYFTRDHHAAIKAADAGLEIAKAAGFSFECLRFGYQLGNAYLHLDDYLRAFTSIRYSHEIAQEHGFSQMQMSTLRLLGFIEATRLASDEGRARLVQAIEYAEYQGDIREIIHGKRLLAIVDQGRGNPQKATVALSESLKLAAEHGHRRYVEEIELALKRVDAGKPIELPL
jgi:serine/threonine protein kinase/tetratricopeptide (TPR) repeat protein